MFLLIYIHFYILLCNLNDFTLAVEKKKVERTSPDIKFDEHDNDFQCEFGVVDSVETNVYAHIGGFLISRLEDFHYSSTGLQVKDCSTYGQILTDKDLNLHCFSDMKEYVSEGNIDKLKYVNESFISFLKESDECFEYIFFKYIREAGLKKRIISFINEKTMGGPLFCKPAIGDFVVDLFVRTKIFDTLKEINDYFRNEDDKKKTDSKLQVLKSK